MAFYQKAIQKGDRRAALLVLRPLGVTDQEDRPLEKPAGGLKIKRRCWHCAGLRYNYASQ